MSLLSDWLKNHLSDTRGQLSRVYAVSDSDLVEL